MKMLRRNCKIISNLFHVPRYRKIKIILLIPLLSFTISCIGVYQLVRINVDCVCKAEKDNNISCYNDKGSKYDLPLAHNVELGSRNILFLETSCRRTLDSRQACAIESAARSNPTRNVVVLFCSQVTNLFLKSAEYSTLTSINNVYMYRIHVNQYVKGTPVEFLFGEKGRLSKSKWKVSHASDILRFLTLYKYGGVYLDLDVIVMKSFDALPRNWVVKQFDNSLSSAMMAISKDDIGKVFSDHTMRELQFDYKPHTWAYNGPLLMDRVIKKMCEITGENYTCNSLQVFDQRLFNPVPYTKYSEYFVKRTNTTKMNTTTITHHFWNNLSHNTKVPVPDSWYAELAMKYCPAVYNLYDDVFGT